MQAAGPGWVPMDRSGVQSAAQGLNVSNLQGLALLSCN